MRCLLLLLALTTVNCYEPLETLFSWKQMDYNFLDESMRKSYTDSGNFIKSSIIPLGLNIWKDKLFITIPRWRAGVSSTLNYINMSDTLATNDKSPRLNPYPNWESNDINKPDSLINILRVRIDKCDRLWGIDNGIDAYFGERKVVHPQRLIAIDLNTGKIILKYNFKPSDLHVDTLFAETVIDVDPDNCDDAYVYNADLGGNAIVVYSLAENKSWRVTHNYLRVDPFNGNFNISGTAFQWEDGVLGMTLSLPREDGSKTLYFHSMPGIHEFYVSTNLLKNQTALADRYYWREFYIAGNKGKNTQGPSSVIDVDTGIIYFTQINRNAISCWDTHNELNPTTFRTVAQDDEKLVFPNDVVIERKSKKFYCLSNNLQLLAFRPHDPEKINFYVHIASLDDMTDACLNDSNPTKCIRCGNN